MLPEGVLGLSSSTNAQVPTATFAGSLNPGANGISTHAAPDIVGKIAAEPGWGHYEPKGIGRWIPSWLDGRNCTAPARAIGLAALLPVAQKLDFLIEGLAGGGIGRYAAAVGPDTAVAPDGSAHPIDAPQAISEFDWTPMPALQICDDFGVEHLVGAAFAARAVGYGPPLADLGGCVAPEVFP